MLNSKVKSIPEALDAIWKPDQAGYKTKRPPGEGENLGSLPSKLTHPRNGHECRGTEKVGHWVRVLQRTNIIPLCKHGLANIVAGSFVHVCVCVCVRACVVCHFVLPAADTGSLGRRHAFIYSSTFWELAMRDKVNTSLYTWVRTNTQACTPHSVHL